MNSLCIKECKLIYISSIFFLPLPLTVNIEFNINSFLIFKIMKEGLTYTSTTIVTNDNCAVTMGSGNLMVFASPAMVALMENAAMMAVASYLPEGSTTVGGGLDVQHTHPSGIGATINASAILREVEGRKLTFYVTACDEKGTIGEGTHVRYIVDEERFMQKVK